MMFSISSGGKNNVNSLSSTISRYSVHDIEVVCILDLWVNHILEPFSIKIGDCAYLCALLRLISELHKLLQTQRFDWMKVFP